MSDWEVTNKSYDPHNLLMDMASLGFLPKEYVYEITNSETGEVKTVRAHDEMELGERIADGRWFEDDDEDDS